MIASTDASHNSSKKREMEKTRNKKRRPWWPMIEEERTRRLLEWSRQRRGRSYRGNTRDTRPNVPFFVSKQNLSHGCELLTKFTNLLRTQFQRVLS